MYLRDSLYVLARRWYVVVPLFLLLALAVNLLAVRTPPAYRSQSTVVLLAPSVRTRADPTLANPYLGFSGNLLSTASILTRAVTTDEAAAALDRQGATADYTVGPDPNAPNAPVLLLETTAGSPGLSERTLRALEASLRTELAGRQRVARAPADIFITLSAVSDSGPRRVETAKKKVLAGGAAVALVLPVLVGFAVEGWAFRRARRKAARAFAPEPPSAPIEPPAPPGPPLPAGASALPGGPPPTAPTPRIAPAPPATPVSQWPFVDEPTVEVRPSNER